MRSGYPWEETTPPYHDILFFSDNWPWLPHIVDSPLTSDPGTEHNHSNLTSRWLGVIGLRASNADLKSCAQEQLFSPINAEVGDWTRDADGHYLGHAEIEVTARDMVKFGLLCPSDGEYEGSQIISAGWVRDALQGYSEDIDSGGVGSGRLGRYFRDIGYGYQWWSARVSDQRFDFALGHGAQLIVLLDELDMVIAATADPLYGEYGWEASRHELADINLVGKLINSLPGE